MKNVHIVLSERTWQQAAWFARTSGIDLDAICGAALEDYFSHYHDDLTELQSLDLMYQVLAEGEVQPC